MKVEIDTAVAKAIHPDQDHSYSITAEVVDQSRRTIVGTGTVLVARKPFTVYAWVDRGYYRVGDTIQADFAARTLDGKPVAGQGRAEAAARSATTTRQAGRDARRRPGTLDTNAEGLAQQQIRPPRPGQYRLSYKIDRRPRTTPSKGGYVFTDHRRGLRRRPVPLQPPRTDPRQARIRARRQGQAADQHRPRRRHGAAVRPAGQRRLSAAEGDPPGRQEHGRGDRRGEEGHAELLRRGGHRRRRPGLHRDEGDRRPAGKTGAERRDPAVARRPTSRARRPR